MLTFILSALRLIAFQTIRRYEFKSKKNYVINRKLEIRL